MVGMLPYDLPFTVFVPSEHYFRRILEPKIVNKVKAIDRDFTEEISVNSKSDNTISKFMKAIQKSYFKGLATEKFWVISKSLAYFFYFSQTILSSTQCED